MEALKGRSREAATGCWDLPAEKAGGQSMLPEPQEEERMSASAVAPRGPCRGSSLIRPHLPAWKVHALVILECPSTHNGPRLALNNLAELNP